MQFRVKVSAIQSLSRMPPAQLKKAEEIAEELLQQGVIRESSSEFNAPIVMVGKRDQSVRLCMDLRGLNKITETVRFPLPTPREMFDQLANSWWYSSMDCR